MIRKEIVAVFVLLFMLTSSTLRAQKIQVGTNAVGLACLGTLNAQIDYAFAQHWSVGIQGRYNPFSFNRPSSDGEQASTMQLKQRCVAALARWWPWHIYSGWWIAGKAQWQEYNSGGIVSQQTEEGQRYGGGLTAGYTHMINKHLNMEFGLGVWGGMKQYTVYACPTCGKRISSGSRSFVMPNDVIIALSYVF